MLMAVKRQWKNIKGNSGLIGGYFKLNLSASMEYRSSFLVQVFGMFLNNLSFAFFWWLLFERFETIGGYGFREIMLLWAFSTSGFGLCFIFFGNANRLVEIIIKGELDSYLLQPKNVLLNVIGSRTRVSAWGDLVYGVILYFMVEGFSLGGTGFFIVISISAGLLYAAVLVTFNALAFYFGNVSSLATLAFEFIITLSIYPAEMFQGIIRLILFTILPAGFMTMVPINLIDAFDLKWFLLLLGAVIVWIGLAFTVFYRGLRKYESGNLMVQKL